MLSQNMGRKRNSGRVLFLSFLIASLRTIFVVWLLLVWDRVLCQNQCTEVAEKWDFFFSTAQLILGKKKSPKPFNIKLLKNSQALPVGKQIQSAGKANKNCQVLFKRNDQIIKKCR